MIALTFDDGPNSGQTEAIMTCLERFGAKGTFFVIGQRVEREPGLVREIAARGHAIGNHTFTHPELGSLSREQVREELRSCREAVESAGCALATLGTRMLMRPPWGGHRDETLEVIFEEGYLPVFWSIMCFDWDPQVTAKSIADTACRAGSGDIVLLHDGDDAVPAGDRAATVAATEFALRSLTADGYRFPTVSALLEAGAGGG